MKKRRIIAAIAIVAVIGLVLGGCMLPGVDPVDPIIPVVPVVPAPAPIAAVFDYYCIESPIQTKSLVSFNGTDSSSPDGEIVWCRWDFGETPDPTIVEGAWVKMVSRWENGIEVWEKESVRRRIGHRYTVPGTYGVTLTVWDGSGNSDSMTRTVRVAP